MRLFVYVLTVDVGFAPNPFFGYCTLATCKPRVRSSARAGDWVAGIGSKQRGLQGKLVYAMRVDEAMSFDEYWDDPRFILKRPDLFRGAERRCGDNIYHRDRRTGTWIQEAGCHDSSDIGRDTNPPRVLIAREFAYFGAGAVDIPDRFRSWHGTDYLRGHRNHRSNFPDSFRSSFVAWLGQLSAEAGGLAGAPRDRPELSPGCAAAPHRNPAARRC